MTTTNHPPRLKRNDPQMAHLPTLLTADAGTWSSLTDSDKLFIPSQSEFMESSIPRSPQIGLWLCAFPNALTPRVLPWCCQGHFRGMERVRLNLENDRNKGMFTHPATNCLNSLPSNLLPTVIDLSKNFTGSNCFQWHDQDCRMIINLL